MFFVVTSPVFWIAMIEAVWSGLQQLQKIILSVCFHLLGVQISTFTASFVMRKRKILTVKYIENSVTPLHTVSFPFGEEE